MNLISSSIRDKNLKNENELRLIFESLHQYYRALGNYLRYGPNFNPRDEFPQLQANYEERVRYYDLKIQREVLQTLIDTCELDMNENIRDRMQNLSTSVLKNLCDKQTQASNFTNDNLIENLKNCYSKFYQRLRASIREQVLNLFRMYVVEYAIGQNITLNISGIQENERLSVMRYEVIQPLLIELFFHVWDRSMTQIILHNECVYAYFQLNRDQGTLRDNIIRQVTSFTDITSLRETFDNLELHGNYFYGPMNRVPYNIDFIDYGFNPRHPENILYRFEYDSAAIIGQEHYNELLNLYKSLIDYVSSNPYEFTSLERYTRGMEIYK